MIYKKRGVFKPLLEVAKNSSYDTVGYGNIFTVKIQKFVHLIYAILGIVCEVFFDGGFRYRQAQQHFFVAIQEEVANRFESHGRCPLC